ncbi:FkbM family methyltransferase [Actinokineospora sp. PR83]|uniref:FkbM family methyltransferase n=1 Tax=Actinokineospora sp. PR83 TaxID=2884908 RepID=UPI001F0297F0|nr:FkbM family methyltransferase [Actinokineospora sp. PR83]MCG8915183.1 FkbM family methyltransferase [Actinokineospora sp. PR83]
MTEHPAVSAAVVRGGTAYVVPDPVRAPLPHRALGTALPDPLAWHEPVPGFPVAGINRTETEFLHREVWADNAYLRHGIALPDGAVVVDAGANIGMFSLFAAAHSPGATIIAVEPLPEAAAAVAANAALHGADVTVVTAAVGDRAGEAEFTFYPGNTVMSGRFADAAEDRAVLHAYLATGGTDSDLTGLVADRMAPVGRRVPVTTLSAVIGERTVDLLKLDVEKAEEEALAGIDDATWPRIRQIAVEVHDLDGRLRRTLDLLADKGFSTAHDQDPRLVDTPCHTVYGRRPDARPGNGVTWAPPPDLAAELGVDRVVFVRSLDEVPEGEAGSRTPAAAVLAEVWAGLFGAEAVHPDADFFALGGNSLTAVRLIAQVEDRLGEDVLAPDTVFTATRLADLTAALEDAVR